MALRDNMVSWWELNETSGTRNDSHGTNHLTASGTGGVGYATGKQGNAADFEAGDSDTLTIADASQSGLDFTSDFSFSAWVKPETQHDGAIFYKWGASQAAYGLIYVDISGTYKLRFNGYSTGGGSNITYDWTQTLSNSTWYHIVFRFDALGHTSGDGTAEVFVNGSSIGTITNGSYTGSSNTTGAFSISGLGGLYQWWWDGLIDEVGCWSRLVTDAEITSLYNSGSGLTYAGTAPAPSSAIKTINGLSYASVKTVNGLAIASVKTKNGLA